MPWTPLCPQCSAPCTQRGPGGSADTPVTFLLSSSFLFVCLFFKDAETFSKYCSHCWNFWVFFYSAVCGLVWSFCPSSTLTQSAGSDCCPHVGNTQFWGFVRAELTNPTLAAVHSCPSELWGEGQCPCLPLAPPQRLCKSHYCFNLPLQDQCCSVPGTGPGPPGQGMGVVPPLRPVYVCAAPPGVAVPTLPILETWRSQR